MYSAFAIHIVFVRGILKILLPVFAHALRLALLCLLMQWQHRVNLIWDTDYWKNIILKCVYHKMKIFNYTVAQWFKSRLSLHVCTRSLIKSALRLLWVKFIYSLLFQKLTKQCKISNLSCLLPVLMLLHYINMKMTNDMIWYNSFKRNTCYTDNLSLLQTSQYISTCIC